MSTTETPEPVATDVTYIGRRTLASNGKLGYAYLEGERTPNVPDGTGVYFGVNTRTFTARHFARAVMEGVTLGMNYGLRRLAQLAAAMALLLHRGTDLNAALNLLRQAEGDSPAGADLARLLRRHGRLPVADACELATE